jgi:hypothetical protein
MGQVGTLPFHVFQVPIDFYFIELGELLLNLVNVRIRWGTAIPAMSAVKTDPINILGFSCFWHVAHHEVIRTLGHASPSECHTTMHIQIKKPLIIRR